MKCVLLVLQASFFISVTSYSYSVSKSIGHCNEWETDELEKEHLQCTRVVEERYTLILEKFQVDIPSPLASSQSNLTKPEKKTEDHTEICNLLHDAVTKCGEIYHKCLNEEEYRQFLDGQLEIFIQLLTTLYSLGSEVSQCEAVQEYQRSGRKDVAHATDKCVEEEVKKLTIRYQQCMENANYDMTRAMLGHQANFDLAFDALCLGIDRVVHECSDLLNDCYTIEEIEETKLGQLELMRKVFLDLIEDTSASEKKDIHWDLDIRKCTAFYKYNSASKLNSSELLVDKFIAFKVPLKSDFDKNVPKENRWNMSMFLDNARRNHSGKIGLIIDLTNTDRFYDAENEVKRHGIKYVKLNCRGHGETPTHEVTQLFINIVENFIRQNPTELIGVHCTHGFNRTGFLTCAYLVEKLDFAVDIAVNLFAECRPPGIYKQDYLNELFRRYADNTDDQVPIAADLPTWETSEEAPKETGKCKYGFDEESDEHLSDEDENEELNDNPTESNQQTNGNKPKVNQPRKRMKRESRKVPVFCEPNIQGIEVCIDPAEVSRVQTLAQKMCNWGGHTFPGAQPISMDQKNIRNLYDKKYMVSWKADGTRYLMLINGRDKVYMLDRDNSVFCVRNLQFPHRKDFDKHLSNTLLDGEFVLDVDPISNQKIPRFLIYDIIRFETDEVGKMNFQVRIQCINKEIIFARNEAIKQGKLNKLIEPFSVRQKLFYPINETKKLLSEDFKKQITHGIDGLIFQPVDDPYTAGRCDLILKWKPPSMNSVDFKLSISLREEIGMLPEKIGELFVTGYDKPFAVIKITKTLSGLHNRIIECRWWEGRWDYMRERTDKSTPNHITTAMAVCDSIKNPVTEEYLIEFIKDIENHHKMNHQFLAPQPPSQMPPPSAQNYQNRNMATTSRSLT